MSIEFQSFEINPDSLPKSIAMARIENKITIIVHATSSQAIANWSPALSVPEIHFDFCATKKCQAFVLSIAFARDNQLIEFLQFATCDRDSKHSLTLSEFFNQKNVEVFVFNSSGKSINYLLYKNDFLSRDEYSSIVSTFPPIVSEEEMIEIISDIPNLIAKEAVIERMRESGQVKFR